MNNNHNNEYNLTPEEQAFVDKWTDIGIWLSLGLLILLLYLLWDIYTYGH